jgi:Protein of Unknown function (DUF2784)
MTARVVADAVFVLHGVFVVFVIAGGALVLWRPRIAALHLPAAAWGAWVELTGTICPLTPLENRWRDAAGEAGYKGSFVEHYLVPVLYPDGLTTRTQIAFGVVVVAVNVLVYGLVWWHAQRRRRSVRRSV